MLARSYALLSSVIFAGAVLLALLLVLLLPAEALAATLTVGVDCPTLAACHDSANPGDTIEIPAGSFATNITITKKLTLNGAGQTSTFLDGEGSHRILNIPVAVPVTLTNLTIQNGAIVTPTGGAIYAAGPLTLDQVAVTDSTAPNGGGIWSGGELQISNSEFARNGCTATLCLGGAILATAPSNITATTFISNAGIFGSGIWSDVDMTVTNSLFTQNTGGGIRSEGGLLTSRNNQFLGNAAPEGGGAHVDNGIFIDNEFVDNHCLVPGCFGGGLFIDVSGVISGGQYLDNVSGYSGGAIFVRETVVMTGALVANNSCLAPTCPGAGLYSNDGAIVTNSVFSNNVAVGDGGGVYVFADLQMENVTFLHNSAGNNGGGAWANGSMTAISATVISNTATNNGGGLYAVGGFSLTDSAVTSNAVTFNGGGIASLSAITLTNNLFSNNRAENSGGAAWTGQKATILNGHFNDNFSMGVGGALGANSLAISGTYFLDNHALLGGGAIIVGGTAVMTNVTALNNLSEQNGGVLNATNARIYGGTFTNNVAHIRGGGVHVPNTLLIEGTTLRSNEAGFQGGGASGKTITVRWATFDGNDCIGSPCQGGALSAGLPGASLIVAGSTIANNFSSAIGGGIYTVGPLTIQESFLINNEAGSSGGGVYHDLVGAADYVNVVLDNNSSPLPGAAVHIRNNDVSFNHVTAATRLTGSGTAIWNQNGTLSIQNSIFAYHGTAIRNDLNASAEHSVFFGNTTNVTGFTLGATNIFADPHFRGPALGNYFPDDGSSAIDAALATGVAIDILGNARPFGPAADIGAFEAGYDITSLAVQLAATPLVDLLPGQPLTYTIVYTNDGTLPALDVTVENILPPAIEAVAFNSNRPITPTGSADYVWNVGNLLVGESGTITVTGRISPLLASPGAITNIVSIINSSGFATDSVALTTILPEVQFVNDSVTVTEQAGQVTLNVTLVTANPYADVIVNYSTVAGTALPGEDFVAANGMITIPAGSTTPQQIQITILHNVLKEGDETFTVALSAAGALVPAPATVTILDNDFGVYLPITRRSN